MARTKGTIVEATELTQAIKSLAEAVAESERARMPGRPRFGWSIIREIGEDGQEGDILIDATCVLWPGMRVVLATYTVEGFRRHVTDCCGILGALDGKAMEEGKI